jgi:MFS family permease
MANILKVVSEAEGPSEVTPLLGNAAIDEPIPSQIAGAVIENDNVGPGLEGDEDSSSPKAMQTFQILLLCYASLAEPVAYFSIFPYINEMVERTGEIPEADVGFSSGMIESLFSLVQMLLMIIYGRMADRLGRKPVLVFSLAGVSFATILFGLSASLWQMIMFRMFAGIFSGSAVTIRTMVSENCDKSTQGRAFSWYMFARNIGILIGTIAGESL